MQKRNFTFIVSEPSLMYETMQKGYGSAINEKSKDNKTHTFYKIRSNPIMSRYQLVVIATVFSFLVACGEATSKLVSSGSSDFGFIKYFIEPLNSSIISIKTSAKTAESGTQHASHSGAIKTQADFDSVTGQVDTVKSTISDEYCSFYAASFDQKQQTQRFYKDPSDEIDVIAPLIAERSYLELMRNYCYSNKAFYLDDTRVNNEVNQNYGEVRWFHNPSTNLGGNKNIDYLVSQSKKDNQVKVLSVFKDTQSSIVSGTDSMYGRLNFTQTPTKERRLDLIRYFVDSSSRTHAIPSRFRQEGYAMSTTTDGASKVHQIAIFMLNYVSDSKGSSDEPNGLVIHTSQFLVHENWGSKLVKAQYCVYSGNDSTRDKSILSTDKITYRCDDTTLTSKTKIDNVGKTGFGKTASTVVDVGYYTENGTQIIKTAGQWPNKKQRAIEAIDASVNQKVLDELSDAISPPIILGKDISQADLKKMFDTSSEQSHLQFE